MNSDDEKLLNALFPPAEERNSSAQIEPPNIPLAEPPEGLLQRLRAIPECPTHSSEPQNILWFRKFKHNRIAMAAAILLAIVSTVFLNHQKQIEEQRIAHQAQQELYTAFLYLDKANRIASKKVTDSLSEGIKKSAIEPVLEATLSTHYPG